MGLKGVFYSVANKLSNLVTLRIGAKPRMKDAVGDVLRQAFMSREEYRELREEEKVWTWLRRPVVMSMATFVWVGVIGSAVVILNIIFPADHAHLPFCSNPRLASLLNSTPIEDEYMHSLLLTEFHAFRSFRFLIFLPTAILFSLSLAYLFAGIAVAYSAPDRHGCLRVVENDWCASNGGGVHCLATINLAIAILFGLFAILLGCSILTLETKCSITLFWCYEVFCGGLVILSGCTFFFLRRKAAIVMDRGEFYGHRTPGMEMLGIPEQPSPEMQSRVNAGFNSWMGSSYLSSDEEELAVEHAGDVWQEDDEFFDSAEYRPEYRG